MATGHLDRPVAFALDGYHLTLYSAALDAGLNSRVMTDIDGEQRPRGMGYDLGADEAGARTYLPFVLRTD
ncbi:MAG: choice-of-anchor Q domain-containing protein [Anaerolineae bacterium]|nr:hypothetical protein [Thermoflexales bacterium]MDW8408382.1 choice-of-anchor Q domain-containing protein [Anaerolineae bacterium]